MVLRLAMFAAGLFALSTFDERPVSRAARCPSSLAHDAARAGRVLETLRGAPEGEELLASAASAGELLLCFGRVEVSGVTADRVVMIDLATSDAAAAARTGHLLLHRREAALFDVVPRDAEGCAAWVGEVLRAESRAYALELRLDRAFGVTPRYAFADAHWAAREDQRAEVILDFLRAHPYGGGGVGALASEYDDRCRRENP